MKSTGLLIRLGIGLAAGATIALVDNVAFAGEVSPIVIVMMLLATTIIGAGRSGRQGWVTAAAAWAFIPLTHLVKHALGLPDTLHPNTVASIAMLAAFTFGVAAVGTGIGGLIHHYAHR